MVTDGTTSRAAGRRGSGVKVAGRSDRIGITVPGADHA